MNDVEYNELKNHFREDFVPPYNLPFIQYPPYEDPIPKPPFEITCDSNNTSNDVIYQSRVRVSTTDDEHWNSIVKAHKENPDLEALGNASQFD